jgi:nitroreductase
MEFQRVVRRRRMVREFEARPVERAVVDRILETSLHAPSAGFAQGLELVVLDEPARIERFFAIVDPWSRKRPAALPPVVVVPLANKLAYLQRYAEPDKRGLGMDVEEGWPVAYWEIDAGMAVMLMLLAAVDAGLGAWLFGVFHGERELLAWLGVPGGRRPIGAVALGHPAAGEAARGSSASRRRKTLEEVVHRNAWRG